MEAWPTPKVGSTTEVPQSIPEVPVILTTLKVEPSTLTEVPIATSVTVPSLNSTPIEVSAPIKIISLEDDMAAALTKALQVNV
ncbi:hypothetical protein COCNU_04G006570 [Cocos nucifera]|uniref:Uncharacterized protein n=1 Tax=Cocos nucifera TaxID=13894 RepID=A0A8K0I5R0_COCNU|nr:hypothetical protein COCNU_04G006570 [Cocos nucifera]